MKTQVKKTRILGLLLLVANLGPSGAALADGPGEIMKAQEAWEASFNTGSAAAAASNYTETARLMPPGGAIIEGKDAIRDFWEAVLSSGPMTLELGTVDVQFLGERAIEIGTWAVSRPGENGQVAAGGHGHSLVVWELVDGTWLMSHDMFTEASGN